MAACLLLSIVPAPLIQWLLPAPYVLYGLPVGIEVMLPPYNAAYRSSCFETEAIYNEHGRDCTRLWWRHLMAWVRYIPNGKYPYIPHGQRPPMQD